MALSTGKKSHQKPAPFLLHRSLARRKEGVFRFLIRGAGEKAPHSLALFVAQSKPAPLRLH
jgi:hypothetical protein